MVESKMRCRFVFGIDGDSFVIPATRYVEFCEISESIAAGECTEYPEWVVETPLPVEITFVDPKHEPTASKIDFTRLMNE